MATPIRLRKSEGSISSLCHEAVARSDKYLNVFVLLGHLMTAVIMRPTEMDKAGVYAAQSESRILCGHKGMKAPAEGNFSIRHGNLAPLEDLPMLLFLELLSSTSPMLPPDARPQ